VSPDFASIVLIVAELFVNKTRRFAFARSLVSNNLHPPLRHHPRSRPCIQFTFTLSLNDRRSRSVPRTNTTSVLFRVRFYRRVTTITVHSVPRLSNSRSFCFRDYSRPNKNRKIDVGRFCRTLVADYLRFPSFIVEDGDFVRLWNRGRRAASKTSLVAAAAISSVP